jgi:hypothetical protein
MFGAFVIPRHMKQSTVCISLHRVEFTRRLHTASPPLSRGDRQDGRLYSSAQPIARGFL